MSCILLTAATAWMLRACGRGSCCCKPVKRKTEPLLRSLLAATSVLRRPQTVRPMPTSLDDRSQSGSRTGGARSQIDLVPAPTPTPTVQRDPRWTMAVWPMRLGDLGWQAGRLDGVDGWDLERCFLGNDRRFPKKQSLKSGLVRSDLRHRIRGRLDCCPLSPPPCLPVRDLSWDCHGAFRGP